MRSELETALYRDMIRFLCRVGWSPAFGNLAADVRMQARDLVLRVPKEELAASAVVEPLDG